jgi:hypothetical protein
MSAFDRHIAEYDFAAGPAESDYIDQHDKALTERERLDAARSLRASFCALSPDGRLATWLYLKGVRP